MYILSPNLHQSQVLYILPKNTNILRREPVITDEQIIKMDHTTVYTGTNMMYLKVKA